MSKRNKIRRVREPQRLTNAFRRAWRDDALREQKGCCRYCDEPMTYKLATSDHVDPRKNGGLDRKQNIVAACAPCNRAKGHLSVKAFVAVMVAPSVTPGAPFVLLMAWSRRRINQRLALMEARLAKATGRRL